MSSNSSFNFGDKKRGLWSTVDGKLYITNPGTKDLVKPPLIFAAPSRIIVSDDFDPFAIILTGNGYIFILHIDEKKIVMKAQLPANAGVIETIKIDRERSLIILESTHGTFTHSIPQDSEKQENHWNIIEEPLDCLETNPDSKAYAQCARIESQIASAVEEKNFEKYAENVRKYLLYIATFLPNPAFISAWYELINSSPPFSPAELNALWPETIQLLSSVERVSSLIDELEMSLSKK